MWFACSIRCGWWLFTHAWWFIWCEKSLLDVAMSIRNYLSVHLMRSAHVRLVARNIVFVFRVYPMWFSDIIWHCSISDVARSWCFIDAYSYLIATAMKRFVAIRTFESLRLFGSFEITWFAKRFISSNNTIRQIHSVRSVHSVRLVRSFGCVCAIRCADVCAHAYPQMQ